MGYVAAFLGGALFGAFAVILWALIADGRKMINENSALCTGQPGPVRLRQSVLWQGGSLHRCGSRSRAVSWVPCKNDGGHADQRACGRSTGFRSLFNVKRPTGYTSQKKEAVA